MDAELQFQCLKIPIKALRNEIPEFKSRKRQDFLDELERRDAAKLRRLAIYHTLNKTKSMYLYELKEAINKKKLNSTTIKNLLNKKIQIDDDPIFIIKQVNVDEVKKEAYLKIQCYSAVRTLKAARPQTLQSFKEDYRSPFLMYGSIYFDTGHVECRSGYSNRAELTSKIISKAIFDKKDELRPIILTTEQQNRLYKSAKAKRAYIEEINWAGCESIVLEGEDVERTLEEFKRKNIDFSGMGGTISLDNRKSSDGFTFFSDGKISFKNINRPYDQIRSLFSEDKNEKLNT